MAHLHNLRLVKFRDTLCFNPRTTGARKARIESKLTRAVPLRRDETRLQVKPLFELPLKAQAAQVTQQVRSRSVRRANDLLFITMYKGFPGTMRKHKVYMRYKFQIA